MVEDRQLLAQASHRSQQPGRDESTELMLGRLYQDTSLVSHAAEASMQSRVLTYIVANSTENFKIPKVLDLLQR